MPVEDTSTEFYRHHARRYAEVAHAFLQSVYVDASHPQLTDDWVLLARAKDLAPGRRCLDAGCGAGARDVYALWRDDYDVYGVDAVEENVRVTLEMHPELAGRVSVADLREQLPFEDCSFDLVLCNAVLQHIPHADAMRTTLPELARVLRPNGVLQLMFKHGSGVLTLFDPDYRVERSFLLYNEHEVLSALASLGLALIAPRAPAELGGIMYLTDSKGAGHCVFHMRRQA
jgi:SAM-dependent methyltransferase